MLRSAPYKQYVAKCSHYAKLSLFNLASFQKIKIRGNKITIFISEMEDRENYEKNRTCTINDLYSKALATLKFENHEVSVNYRSLEKFIKK